MVFKNKYFVVLRVDLSETIMEKQIFNMYDLSNRILRTFTFYPSEFSFSLGIRP